VKKLSLPLGGRHIVACLAGVVVLCAAAMFRPAPAADASPKAAPPANAAANQRVDTNILASIYQSGYARLARGDATGARAAFQIVRETAPQLAEANYALALATTLADFAGREQAMPLVTAATSLDPGNPYGAVIAVLADPRNSTLRPDGALYLTAASADRLRRAAQQLPSYAAAPNGAYAAAFLNSMQDTGDAAFPARFANFNRMIGQGGTVRLPKVNADVMFGQLFQLRVSEARFAPYEQILIARLQNGLKSLEDNQDNLSRLRARIQQLHAKLDSNDPTERVVALANLDKLLSDLDDIIVRNETTIASIKVIVDNVGVNQTLAQKKEEVKKEEAKLVAIRNAGKALEEDLKQKKAAVSQVERERLAKVKEVNDAQRKLNELEKRLADAESQLASSSRSTAQAEQAVQARNRQLAELDARAEALRKQQAAAEQLDSIKQQQTAAAAQLDKLHQDIQQAEAAKQGNLAALHRQETDLAAKVAALQADVAAGEKARQQADQLRQELASLQERKSAIEAEMRSAQANLASLKAERDALQQQVDAMRRDQEKQIAERSRLAQFAKEVDFGRYFALVIGNDEYKEWPKLKTAVNDAKDIAAILQKKYGFRVKLLTNATRADILNAFDDYVDEIGPNDNLLIYYAGHGIVEQGFGYWVPVDGDAVVPGHALRTQNLVRHADVIDTIKKLRAKQVMVIADSCFAGGLAELAAAATAPAPARHAAAPAAIAMRGVTFVDKDGTVPVAAIQGVVAQTNRPDELVALQHWASRAARVVLTSGGNEPVVDQLKAGDKHSVFAQALLGSLQKNKDFLKSIELINTVQDEVVSKSGAGGRRAGPGTPVSSVSQTPSYTNLLGYNGEFLFVARN